MGEDEEDENEDEGGDKGENEAEEEDVNEATLDYGEELMEGGVDIGSYHLRRRYGCGGRS